MAIFNSNRPKMNMRAKLLHFVVFTLSFTSIVRANEHAFVINNDFKELIIPSSFVFLACDSSAKLAFEDIDRLKFNIVPVDFKKQAGLTYWTRFTLDNKTSKSYSMIVYAGRTENLELYHPDLLSDTYQIRKNGRKVAYDEKDIQGFINYGNYVRIEIPADTSLTYYAKSHFDRYFFVSREVIVELADRDMVLSHQYFYNLLGAFFIGGLFVMALYTGILALVIRDIVYYYYVVFIVFGMLFYIYYYGFTIEWLWPDLPNFDIYSFVFILSGTFISWLLFSRSYLKTYLYLKAWEKYIVVLVILNIFPSIIVFYDIWGNPAPTFLKQLQNIQNLFILITLLSIMIIAYSGYRKKINAARFFLLANLAMLVGSFMLSLRFFNLLPNNAIVSSSGQLGFFFQMILFSVGLGDRINRMQATILQKDIDRMKVEREREFEKHQLIEQKNIELEKRVSERTAEVLEQKLEVEKQATKLVEKNEELIKVNAYKDRLFSIIGHDLRNPIGTLKGVLELFDRGLINTEDVKRIGKEIQKSLGSIMSMLDNLLMWALQELDEVKVNRIKFDLRELIEENIDLMQPQASIKEVRLNADDFPKGLVVDADREMIKLTIRNLISNSLKFTENQGKVWVTGEKTSDFILVTIHDSGIGMPEEKMRSLFDGIPDSTYGTNNEKGTGLGLRLCHEFVHKNGGKISVESEPGVGSKFTVSLPSVDNATSH